LAIRKKELVKQAGRGMKGGAADRATESRREADRLPDYGNPPVSEVACGISFEPLKQFLLPHVGLYWARIKDKFPICEQAAPYSARPEPGWIDSATGLPLPRLWFITENSEGLIQLQGDCFFYNWRRLGDEGVYPRYQRVIATYRECLTGFIAFLSEQKIAPPSVTSCELTYVNHIPQEQGWDSTAQLSKVFTDFCWSQRSNRFLPPPKNLTWKVQFPLPDNKGNLTVDVQPAKRVKDQMPTLKFEISAKNRSPSNSIADTWAWFDLAHDWIVRGFADLTQEDFQRRAWKKIHG
jgi:uncharacterized protein (TIGR04255 family)